MFRRLSGLHCAALHALILFYFQSGKLPLMKALYQYKFQFPCKTPCTVDRKSQSARIEAKGRITLEILKALVAAVLLIQELMRSWSCRLLWEQLQPALLLLWGKSLPSLLFDKFTSLTSPAPDRAFVLCSLPPLLRSSTDEHHPKAACSPCLLGCSHKALSRMKVLQGRREQERAMPKV